MPSHFVLYGGTALALRLGHRASIDFGYFSSESFGPGNLQEEVGFLCAGKPLQTTKNTLTVSVDRGGPIKVSFFGGLSIGRVGEPDLTNDGVAEIASLLDLGGTKAALVTQRAESKDYLDILALLDAGIPLEMAMAAAATMYRKRYNPVLTLKALAYFGDGDLHLLSDGQKERLITLAGMDFQTPPGLARKSDRLSGR